VENIVWSNESTDPTLVYFSRTPEQQAAKAGRVRLDADGDGQWDIDIPPSGSVTYRFKEEGIYAATALLEGATPTRSRFWINAVGPRERKGIWVSVYQPVDGQIVATDIAVKVRAISYSGDRVERVTLTVDGKHMDTVYKPPFDLQVPWTALRAGRHEMEISAFDRAGNQATLKRVIERAPYFDLQPREGAAVTGETVIVRWTGYEFGQAQVRYRRQGTERWQVVVGEHAIQRAVALQGLEAGVAYEFQPLGDGEWGPIRRFSRVKGLAFARSRYGANIARDYDQRLAISVRNHAEHPMAVRLHSVAPQESRLLVGFVGEGSENVPFTLNAGEEREFMLGISAQDALKPLHSFPVCIESAEGLRDEALVEVKVKLPEVVLKWEALGPSQEGMSQRFRLRNDGDTLTDLQIVSDQSDAVITPAVDHATFPRGATLEVTVTPALYEGFQQLQGKLMAKALAKTVSQDFEIALDEGKSVYPVTLSPGDSIEDVETRMLQDAYRMVGANLDAAAVDWSSRQFPEDTDGDGNVDRWFMILPQNNTLWVGDDTDGDGQVDFAHADVGNDGKFDYSAYKTQDRWQQTNIVETWLELNFRLPWARSRYEKHDVEIVLNDQVVGTLNDQIPEGNYRFRLPPSAVNLGDKENQVMIRSKHLRGGHYVVSSDFRIMLRLTGAKLWGIGTSREDAGRRLRQTQEIMVDAPDYSVSSRELRIEGELQAGKEVTVTIPLRNLGARRTWYVPVALVRSQPGRKDVTVAEQLVEGVSLIDSAPLSIPWKIEAGSYQLKVVVDPDNLTPDQRRENNVAMLSVDIAGDTTVPTAEIQQPLEGTAYETSLVMLEAMAKDDVGIAVLEVQIDGGLWAPLTAADQSGAYRGKALLQPGAHRLTFRTTDLSGNLSLHTVNVRSNAPQPRIDILQPQAGSDIDARQTTVIADVGTDVIFAAGRINNGSWTRLAVKDGQAKGAVPLAYGSNVMELMVANNSGTVNHTTVTVTATRQPSSDEIPLDSVSEDGRIEIEGLGVIDLFGSLNRVIGVTEQNSSGATSPDLKSWPRIAQLLELLQPVNIALASGGAPENTESFPVLPSCNGATVVLQKNKTDWYCTNRPKINVGFRLPQWVMDLDIPDPDKNPEQYEKMIRGLMERLARNGVDTEPFKRYFDALLKRVNNLDHVTQLPQGVSGFFQWLGISANMLHPPGQDPESLARWRKQLANKTKIFWARLLSTEDTALIAEGLKRRMQATRKFDEGVALEAQAVIDAIGAHQQLTQDVLEIVPLVGEGIDLYAAFTGTAPLTGQQLSAFERSVRAIAFLGPIAFDSAMARYAGADDVTDVLLGKSDDMARSMQDFANRLKDADFRQAVAKATKGRIPEEELLKASENILASKRLRELIEAAGNSPRGRAWETFIAKRGGGVDLNDLNRNFPIIDWITPKGEYVSIYNSLLKGDKLASDLVSKYMDLFGFGADPKKMFALLKKHGHAISEIDFFKKARFHVPTKEHADLFRKTLLDRFNEFGLDEMILDSADLLRKAWPGASDKQLLQKMMDMVMYTDNLPKVVQPVGAMRRAILRSPAVIGGQLSGCDAE
ncbi:MAG: hypothetical protein KKA76_02780, partial [Proteobacteria bacterium]|nr:hypothetical protein [Pseudomonadota bacterium]